ncbi:MAG: hypothetical protein KJ970_12835 [Candidatus Eisenbacteria bacterium]|uniref:Uncharacterized protein n=1 Tax=Eiseniibacteriota bacterium TaxID=2212470 RepID=A0A948RY99_UNCEI|nr:hypothetical protein [Candidatus Eisenbacteria bacterium]MBU1947736.1 hypothetical protein [Candidatus Eisenbacteria bacterium]MBU2691799.1 hypothetical protein [Candidatus Eisenbacteria bacterium]
MNRQLKKKFTQLNQTLLTRQLVEEWYQEELGGSSWYCLNPSCSVSVAGFDAEPVDGADGQAHCPNCSERLYYRCGKVMLPVGDIVPPDICTSCCTLYAVCIRYRLHRIWWNEMLHQQNWMMNPDSRMKLDDFWEEEEWNVRGSNESSGDGNGV